MAPKTPRARPPDPRRRKLVSADPGMVLDQRCATSMLPRHIFSGRRPKATMEDDLDDVAGPDDIDDDALDLDDADEDEDIVDVLEDDLAPDLEDDGTDDDDVDDVDDVIEVVVAAPERIVEEEDEDEDEPDDEDVEASLDVILKERLVVEDEPDDDDVPDIDDRSEPSERVRPKQPDEFVCRSCFLVKHPSQLADKKRMLCRDCV